VDFFQAYTLTESPLYALAVADAARCSGELAARTRARGVPVFHTRVVYSASGLEALVFVRKVPTLQALVNGSPLIEFILQAASRLDDVVLVKQYASAFFGTSLAPAFTAARIDTVLLTGCSTSVACAICS
tara:strand:- start:1904 stop:2293 length:390 start_codon:yes stop_codon:yes gene_type:complete